MPENFPADFKTALESLAEDLGVEFKRSLPLSENIGKAKLAKEICALANHGGGWIVLGREDDGSYPEALPDEIVGINQDTVNQIATTYLQPVPHCSVGWQKPEGIEYEVPVIQVPACETAPVCACKNGRDNNTKGPQGVVKGTHYIRKAGPVSAPIEAPHEWHEVIRRCVLSDQASLLAALTTMIAQPRPASEDEKQSVLNTDFEYSIAKWKKDAQEHPYDIDLTNCFLGYGFQLLNADMVTTGKLTECLGHRPHDKHGGHVFFKIPYSPREFEVAGNAGLEVHASTEAFDHRSVWRLSDCLSGTEVISYWEDTEWIKKAVEDRLSLTWDRGQHIWIAQQIAYANSFLATVKHISDHFTHTGDVRIRFFFSGLSGRNLKSAEIGVFYNSDCTAHQNTKEIDFVCNVSDLAFETRSATIASIIEPMNKLFQGPEVTAKRVVDILGTN